MKCPNCEYNIPDDAVRREAARISGKESRRPDSGGKRCPVHGTWMRRDGTCKRCENQRKHSAN